MKALLLFFSAMLVFYGHSQNKIYDSVLQNYKYRTEGFTALLLKGGAASNLNVDTENKTDGASVSINPGLEYYFVKSTDRKLKTTNAVLQPQFSFRSQKGNVNYPDEKYSIAAIRATYQTTVQTYTGLRFFEKGLAFQSSGASEKLKYADSLTNKERNSNVSLQFTVGFGKGRLENVTDAQMAYFILNDLQNQKLLTRQFSASDMQGLAKTITNINNTRLFDFRRRRKFELQQIDSFLQQSNLTEKYNIDYFTTLTDNWYYAFNPYRVHGKQQYIKLQPGVGTLNQSTLRKLMNTSSLYKTNVSIYGGQLILGIDDKRAINLKRQFNKGVSLTTSYNYTNSETVSDGNMIGMSKGHNTFSRLEGYLEWGFFPGTRTNVFVTLYNQFLYGYGNNDVGNFTNLSFIGNYFISYNTRLFVNAGLGASISSSNNLASNTQLNNSFSFGIEHFFR